MEKKTLIILSLIVFFGFILRFIGVSDNPPGLNWDEVSHGYNAYSVLKTGMDQWGEKIPLFNFRAYGDYPATLNLYLTIPFILIFGLSDFAIRFPHVLLGTLTIISAYFLTFGITRKNSISLFAAFLCAIGPWYLFTSRIVLQSNLSVFLLITSAAFFVNRFKNPKNLSIACVLFFLTLFSYHTTRIFSPLMLIGLLVIYKSDIKNKLIYPISIFFFILTAFILLNPASRARGNLLFIVDQGGVNKIEAARNNSKLPSGPTKLLYNRPTFFIKKFSQNYIRYFSPSFLFFKGGTQYQFSIPNRGLIYPISLIFFYVGLLILFKKSVWEKNYRFLLLWFMLAPIPASLTNESYTVLRATTMLPIPEILISLAFFEVISKVNRNLRSVLALAYILILLISLRSYLIDYFSTYRINYSWSWQYGYKDAVNYVKGNYNNYDNIIITKKYGEPHEYFLYYLKYDPKKYLEDPAKISYFQSNWYWVDRFDKFYFVNDWQIKDLITETKVKINCESQKCLLITSPDNVPIGFTKLDRIKFLDGQTAFEIYEN